MRKLNPSEKIEILQIGLILWAARWENIFYNECIMDERNNVFPYFYHGIIFYSAELFDCTVNLKFYLNVFIFLNITYIKHRRSNIWIKKQQLISGPVAKRFCEALTRMCEKGVLNNFPKLTGKHLCESSFFNKVAGFWPVSLWKKRPKHRCFPVNFASTLRTPFFKE